MIKSKCPQCQKTLELTTSVPFTDSDSSIVNLDEYKCGHFFINHSSDISLPTFPTASLDGQYLAFDFQERGVEFVMESDYNCLIGDQMGLGKTIQALLALRAKYESKTPCLILVKRATLWQWCREYEKWCDNNPDFSIYPILDGKSFIPRGFKSYITSMDTFSRDWERFYVLGIKLIIVDECHSFKNTESKRAQALVDFVKKARTDQQNVTFDGSGGYTGQISNDVTKLGLIFLSGTPIKNRADEYFVPLNLMRPDKFPSLERFSRRWLVQSSNGKWERINPYALQQFRDEISPFVIRRERSEVLTGLPPFKRNFHVMEITDGAMKTAYNAELAKLQEKEDMIGCDLQWTDVSDSLMTLRKIIGYAKTEWAIDYVNEFMSEIENEKLAIGVHHHVVRDRITSELKKYRPVGIRDGFSADRSITEWQHPDRQICVISELAGGVGLNLQFCNNVLILERQWNSADEEQFEDRFNRIGQDRPVTVDYPIARGTVDEYFHEMVSRKRKIFGETIGNKWALTGDSESISDLVHWAINNRLP